MLRSEKSFPLVVSLVYQTLVLYESGFSSDVKAFAEVI